MLKYFISISLCLIMIGIVTPSFAEKQSYQKKVKKERLVLMPLRLADEDRNLQGAMEVALVNGLQDRYEVFSGENVQQKVKAIFLKESKTAKAECDETRCMEDIGLAFQSELIAVANVTRRNGGFFLAIIIRNIVDNKVVYSESLAFKNSDEYEMIEKLKELARGKPISDTQLPKTIAPVVEEKQIQANNMDAERALWTEVQNNNTEDNLNVYLDTYPNGKYVPLAKARLKKFKDAAKAAADNLEKESWTTAQQINTQDSYTQYVQAYPKGKFVSQAKSSIKKLKDDLEIEAQNQEQRLWESAQKEGTKLSYSEYLDNYPNGKFAALAKVKMNKIKTQPVVAEAQTVPYKAPVVPVKKVDFFEGTKNVFKHVDNPFSSTLAIVYLPMFLFSDFLGAPSKSTEMSDAKSQAALHPSTWGKPDSMMAKASREYNQRNRIAEQQFLAVASR